jgi:hypothetical protein
MLTPAAIAPDPTTPPPGRATLPAGEGFAQLLSDLLPDAGAPALATTPRAVEQGTVVPLPKPPTENPQPSASAPKGGTPMALQPAAPDLLPAQAENTASVPPEIASQLPSASLALLPPEAEDTDQEAAPGPAPPSRAGRPSARAKATADEKEQPVEAAVPSAPLPQLVATPPSPPPPPTGLVPDDTPKPDREAAAATPVAPHPSGGHGVTPAAGKTGQEVMPTKEAAAAPDIQPASNENPQPIGSAAPALLPDTAALPPPPREIAPTRAERPVLSAAAPRQGTPGAQAAGALHVLASSTPDSRSMTVRLDPIELGHVQISIERHKDGPTAVSLSAERPETLLLLLRDQTQIHHALDSAGIPPENRSLTFQLAPAEPKPQDAARSLGAEIGGQGGGSNTSSDGGQQRGSARRNMPELPTLRGAQADLRGWLRSGIDITA